MNVVFISPHFPPSWELFCVRLRERGATVLGVADAPHESFTPLLREALSDYYRVARLEDHGEALRALGWLTHRHGKVDRIASHNEYWLELEGYLREHFNVPGRKLEATELVRRKSLMKRTFVEAGVSTAPGRIVRLRDEASSFVAEVGYPVIAKPDKGVGAAATWKLAADGELESFFREKPPVDYFLEAFIEGSVVTFDGLAGREGDLVFSMSLEYSRNILDVVTEDDHVYYYTLREIPDDVAAAGAACVRAFELREQFFHFEFFRTPEGRLLALEINARPPGWPTLDLFNYANDADAYREWANVVTGHGPEYAWTRQYHAMFIGRKDRMRYRHVHDDIVRRCGHALVESIHMPLAFSRAMGDHAYLVRAAQLDELLAMAAYIHDRA
jgi:hypothetical protein